MPEEPVDAEVVSSIHPPPLPKRTSFPVRVLLVFALVFWGYVMFGIFTTMMIEKDVQKPTPPAAATPPQKQRYIVYAPIRDLVCATNSRFLDSSPVMAPARFVQVKAGTEVVMVGYGGMMSDLYWKLSAGGPQTIYVYKNDFDRDFVAVGSFEK